MTCLRISNISKSYAAPVLKQVNLAIEPGEIHALVGENGAGKSTLINILCGLTEPNAGKLELKGQAYRPKNPVDAMSKGLSVALQELSLIDDLSVAENILLRKLPNHLGYVNQATCYSRALALMQTLGLSSGPNKVSPNTEVAKLSLAQKQLLELCKALSEPCDLLILDEPTSALSQQQSDILHTLMHEQAAKGMSILYVSHRLDDVLNVCHKVSVLRDGQLVSTNFSQNTTKEQLISAMSRGTLHEHTEQARNACENDNDEPVLLVNDITTDKLPQPLSFKIRRGEILGIGGLAGAGRTELLEAIYGLTALRSGQVQVLEQTANRATPRYRNIKRSKDAVRAGIGMLSEDRKQQGIFAEHSLIFNASIASLNKTASLGFVRNASLKALSKPIFDSLGVKRNFDEQNIEELSGGNQQKVLLGRWLQAGTDIFLLDEPTRGVDVSTKALIYRELENLASKGASIIVVSSEAEELFTLCHRILVMSQGRFAGELLPAQYSSDNLLSLAFSQAQ
uniref:sugar ABC transporter ATP-binding protein n=1 Tax=Ningiella ruwaisensis TaxID=2364274 RepID=UPI0010A011EB|nr:sugar ABC transporter ATP-binding protein [Ningiella ruwaisensis]